MTLLKWNRNNKLLAAAYTSGQVSLFSVTPSRDQPGSSQVDTVQTIEFHKKAVTCMAWSDNGRYLSTGDISGKVAFWMMKNKQWKHILTNSTIASKVCSMAWNKACDTVCIAYENSNVACVTAEGDLLWSTAMRQPVTFVEWTAHGGNILCGTAYGEVMIVDNRGVETGTVQMPCLQNATTDPKIVGLEWQRRTSYGLLIAFQGGNLQLMRNEHDTQPIVVKIDMELTATSWFKNGSAIAVAGMKTNGKSVVVFLTAKGDVIRELEIQGAPVMSLSLDPNDTQLAMGIENVFCLAQIVPSFTWAFTKNTLLYTYNNSDGDEYTLIYYNHKTGDKRVHSVSNILAVGGDSGIFAIANQPQLKESTLNITDTIGVTLGSITLKFLPQYISVSGNTIAAASESDLAVWRYNEEEHPQTLKFDEKISAIHMRRNQLFLSLGNNLVVLDVPSLAEINKFSLGMAADGLDVSSDGTTLSAFNSSGTLQFYKLADGKVVGPAKKEVWGAAWATDNPSQFVACERQKLFVYNDLEAEDPIQSLSYIASVSDLEILCVDLIRLMQDPLNPGHRIFKTHPTRALREMKGMLANRPQTSIDEILDYCKTQRQNKLWDVLAEVLMVEMNFSLAEKCYLETTNYKGLQFLKRVRAVKDSNIQRAQVLSYLGRFDEAQSIYNAMDRLDLAVEMRSSIGDYERVINIVGPNRVGNDDSIATAYTNVGDSYAERSEWVSAAEFYEFASNDMKLAKCLYLADDVDGLEKLMMKTPPESPLMPILGRMFVSIGAIDNAVAAFTSCNDIAAAIDACARLNHWKPALDLAGKGRSEEIRRRMNQYANELIENNQTAAAIDFYVRAGLSVEAAKLLQKQGDDILKVGDDYLSAKMCYVFAGLQLEKHRSGAFDGTVTATERLDGLMREDEAVTSGLLSEVWSKAEAVHFYLLAHRLMYSRRWMDALLCAMRVFEDYGHIIGHDKAAALTAMCALKTRHYKQCSRAFTTLEHFEDYSPEKRAAFEELAIDIFTKNPPEDYGSAGETSCGKCGADMSIFHSQCAECGTRVDICVSTGHQIIDGIGAWECKYCRHKVLVDIVGELTVCPMCHHHITS